MRKSKRGPALFEVLGAESDQASSNLKVPNWWAGQDRGSSGGVIKLSSHPAAKETAKRPAPLPETTAEPTKQPVLAFADGCLRLSLTSTYAAAAVFIALTVVFVVFELGSRSGFADGAKAGRASYMAETASEIDLARQQKPATHLVANLLNDAQPGAAKGTEKPSTKAAANAEPRWIKGFTYIVAQEFRTGREEDAGRAQAFLASHGVEATIIPLATGSTQLITVQGFNHGDSTQKRLAIRSLQEEHRIGGKYFAQGGGYRLKGYFKKLTGDRW